MSSGVAMPFWFMLLFLALLPGLGIYLLRIGLRRNHGRTTTPHCALCGYNLTALTSSRCPECGTELTPAAIRRGEPQRAPILIASGLFCLLIFSAIFVPMLFTVNWYALQPTSWLISDLSGSQGLRAWRELDQRLKAGTVSAPQVARLIDYGLKVQTASSPPPFQNDLMNILGRCVADGSMTDAQKKTFLDQMITVTLSVRPKVIDGDSVPYTIAHTGQGPNNLWVEVSQGQASTDQEPFKQNDNGYSRFSGENAGGSTSSSVHCRGIGRHTLRIQARVRIYAGTSFDPTVSRLLREETMSRQAAFEIVPDTLAYRIKSRKGTAAEADLRAAIVPGNFSRDTQAGPAQRISGDIKFNAVPDNLAFEIVLKTRGKEYEFGSVHLTSGQSTTWRLSTNDRVPAADRCDLILRSSTKAAKNTVELTEIWEGELIFKDVPIPPDTATTSPIKPTSASAPAPESQP